VSVVLPVRLAAKTVERTVESLFSQVHDYTAEVIAVVAADDPTLPKLSAIQRPNFRCIALKGKQGVPHLRRHGVRVSHAQFVLIAEDHCIFPLDWIRSLVGAIERTGAAASGGPVTNGRRSWVGWAQYFTRYSSFMPPIENGPTASLPGNNACYRREVIESLQRHLEDGFWEAEFNAEVKRSGRILWSCPEVAVIQRQQRGMIAYLPLRFRHGRCYGARRVVGSPHQHNKFLAMSGLVPFLLLFRIVRNVFAKKNNRLRLITTLPLVVPYIFAWSLGELSGYLAGTSDSCEATD
jgi:glycosyltransferase involved in cell wall biosynthesis